MKGAWKHWDRLPETFPYLRPYRKFYVLSMFMTVMAAVVALAEPWPLAIMVDSVLDDKPPTAFLQSLFGPDPDRYTLLVFAAAAGFFVTIFGHGLTVVNNYVDARIEQNMILDLRSNLFKHVQRLSLTFHDSRATGQLMSQINLQASALGDIVMAFPPIVQNFLTLVGMLVIALLIDWQVTLISLIAVPFIYYSLGLYGTKIVPRIQKVQSLEFRSLSIVFEAMSMLRVIVAFGRQRYEHRRFRDQGQTAVDERVKLTVRQTLFSLAVTGATAAGTSLVLGFGAWHVIQGQITTGELLVLMAYIAAVYQPLEQISNTLGNLHQQFIFLNASLQLLEDEPEVKEDPEAVDIGRAKGAVTFDTVNFAYEGREDTLKDLSFHVEPGQRVAIVGPTGAGKTTLVSLLVRFYDPKEGTIKIDGQDISKLTLKCLRDQISVVLQEPVLFSGTITENIRYGRLDATMDEVIDAAKAANAHDFILTFPDGYQTELGERGAQLSGGERQRISVARAFIRNAPILILDEPTSSIDSKTENVILDALDELMVGRTSFLIAHRLSTIRNADLILVMNQGELVEQGSHEELIERGGLYSQLCAAQERVRVRPKVAQPAAATAEELESLTEEQVESRETVRQRVRIALGAVGGGGGGLPAGGLQLVGEGMPLGGDGVQFPTITPGNGGGRPGNGGRGAGRSGGQVLLRVGGVECNICGRTLEEGEKAEPFIAPAAERRRWRSPRQDGRLKLACEACSDKARQEGWASLTAVD
jgi:ATP-binding cassette, subfamily B, bacterial